MARRKNPALRWAAAILGVVVLCALGASYIWREEILRTALDPKQPFQTYRPPPTPNYADARAWALWPNRPAGPGDPPADVFFVHPTTYDGGRDWNGPIGEARADRFLFRVVLPNDAGPFQRVGRVFAPRYRQASLYAFLTLRDDAREARMFAYTDVRAAFATFIRREPTDRPLILAGVGQGGEMLARLIQEVVAKDPDLLKRLAAVYLINTATPAADFAPGLPLPACTVRDQARCVIAWAPVWASASAPLSGEAHRVTDRALVWTSAGRLVNLGSRAALCINPMTGGQGEALAPAKLNRGAASASGLEWGVRPAFMAHQVSAQCQGGLLHVSRPRSPSLQLTGSWADRRKAAPYNLFYADIEADAQARVDALLGHRVYGPAAPPIQTSVAVTSVPIRRID